MGNRSSSDDPRRHQIFPSVVGATELEVERETHKINLAKVDITANQTAQAVPTHKGTVYESSLVRSRKPGLRISRLDSSGLSDSESLQKAVSNGHEVCHVSKHKQQTSTLATSRRRHMSNVESNRILRRSTLGVRELSDIETTVRQSRQQLAVKKSEVHPLNHRIKADAGGDHVADSSSSCAIRSDNRSSNAQDINETPSALPSYAATSRPSNTVKAWHTTGPEHTQSGSLHPSHLTVNKDDPGFINSKEANFSQIHDIRILESIDGSHVDTGSNKNDSIIIQKFGNPKTQLQMRTESVQSLSLLIESLKTDIDVQQKRFATLQVKLQSNTQQAKLLGSKLNASREIGIKLEAANGRFITESMKNKYLRMESEQLNAELDRRKSQFTAKQVEKRDLSQELERLKWQKTQYERHYKEALLESKFTTEQLRQMNEKCKTMEAFRDEEKQLLDMMCNLQAALGRVRVFGILETTPHESCVQYVSSSEVTFTPPAILNLRQGNGTAVRCRLSYIVPPGSCNALELFNEITTTIDGVIDGLNACLAAVGPRNVGKSSTIFGEPRFWARHLSSSKVKRKALAREWRTRFQRLSRSISFDFGELTRSVEFASLYGLLGLCLVHMLQIVSLKTTLDANADLPGVREYRIQLSAALVPLCSEKPEFDLFANDYVNYRINDRTLPGKNGSSLYCFHLESHNIATVADVLRVCDVLQAHLKHSSDNSFLDYDAAHKVVIADVHTVSQEADNERQSTAGVVVFVDTFGLNHDTLTPEPAEHNGQLSQSAKAWNDVSSLIELMRSRTNSNCFETNRLLRLIQPCVLPRTPSLPRINCTACMILLHLPCDKQHAYITMQCLRLGLWVMNTDPDKYFMGQETDGSNGSNHLPEASKWRGTCSWRIGLVGNSVNVTASDSSGSRTFDRHLRSTLLGRSNSICGPTIIDLEHKTQKAGEPVLQRTTSIR